MLFDWTAERERQMLLMAIQQANLKPTIQLWSSVATSLGGGLTPSAVSQKYYKLKNESAKLAGRGASAPSNPLRPISGTSRVAKSPASARVRKPKRDTKVNVAEAFLPTDLPKPSPPPSMNGFPKARFYKERAEEKQIKREEYEVKHESRIEHVF